MGSRPNKRHYLKALWAVAVLLALFGASVAWLFTADLGVFKPQFERIISERAGRQFSINGELHIHLGRSLTIEAANLELGNPSWAAESEMFSVGRLSAHVNLWSIFSGPVIVDAIEIDDVMLRLTENENHGRNWEFATVHRVVEAAGTSDGLGFMLKILEIDAAHVIYESAHRPEPVDIQIFSLRNQLLSDDMLDMSITAAINGRDVKFHGAWGTWSSLLAGGGVGFDASGQLDTISLQAKGRIDDLKNPSRPEFDFTVTGPSIADLSVMLGLGAVGEGNIDISGSLGAENDGPLMFRSNGNLGLTRINALGSLAAIDNFDNVAVKLSVGGPSLGRFLSYFGVKRVGDSPFELALDLRRREQELLINDAQAVFGGSHFKATARMPQFPAFKDAVVSIKAMGEHIEQIRYLLGIPGVTTGPFSVKLNVNTDKLGQPRLETILHTTVAKLEARGLIGDPPNYRGSQVDFKLVVNSLLQIGDLLDVAGFPEQPATVRGAIVLQENRIELKKPLQLHTEGIAATISGGIDLTPQFSGTKIQFEIEGADFLDTSQRFNADLGFPSVPYKALGTLEIKVDGVALQGMVAELGSSKFRLEGVVSGTGDVFGTRLIFSGAGPSIEELFSGIDDVAVFPGAFTMAGKARLSAAELAVENFKLESKQGQVMLNARIGRPFTMHRMELQLDANGPDVRSVLNGLAGFEPDRAPFSIKVRADRDGSSWSFLPFEASFGSATMEAQGQLMLASQSVSGSLAVKVEVPDLAQLGTYEGRRLRPQPLRLNATLSGDGERIVVDNLEAGIGVNHISGRLTYQHATIPDLEFDLQSESLIHLPIFAAENDEQGDAPATDDGRVIPVVEIPFNALQHVNATFSFDIAKLQQDDMLAENVVIRGRLRDGTMNVENLQLDIHQGSIAGRGTVATLDSGGQVHLDVTARNLNHLGADLSPTHADIDLDITATGSDLRQLAKRTNGFVAVHSVGGEFARSAFLDRLYGGIADKLLDTINPLAKSGTTTKLECTVFLVDIVDGVIQGSPSTFLKTDKIRLLANTEVDLATEAISVAIRSRPSGNLTLLSIGEVMNPYLGIGGTLGDPRITFDEKGALIAGGAAVATSGLSIVAKGLWDRMKGAGDPCSDAAEQVKAFVSAHRETLPEPE